MTTKALCIHGHFYQPPREDPLTAEIPQEEGAAPFPNWNERIYDHCYAPNAQLNNFEHLSFNVGPTLWNWMFEQHADTCAEIVAQEHVNWKRYGVSNAMAQPYNHSILPLANKEDKLTQLRWGMEDFEFRYGHQPQGMWLPETAVDQETLEILLECGIEYTILAPWQVEELSDGNRPYIVAGKGKHKLTAFFYNRVLSTRVSFDPTSTVNADEFLKNAILPQFTSDGAADGAPQLVTLASDGELYGHHQPFRDKFLQHLLNGALKESGIAWTYPALWLKEHPAKERVVIKERTSWSCPHGVARWAGPCGCTPHGKWKLGLRSALDALAQQLDLVYLDTLKPILKDPWELRHRYIQVLHGQKQLVELLAELGSPSLSSAMLSRIEVLLAAQVERQRMFTSCGWFFEDFDRIEPKNNVRYAAQAVWLTQLSTGVDLSSQAMEELQTVKSWKNNLRADEVFCQHLERAERVATEFRKTRN
jgi:alpha-amylase/alpha-mannosidase (GH57 family)